ncbi:hypothetical protein L207DRAFT_433854 [Hyaloscypha variabilis F]|uniref:Serine/threonine-protein kinase ppk6 n=1 Tax=Hyaloscypha variabilis (strain UAMH 11265 / GT02V1 / F) TaxID=1149755 RepID=A0A2J6RD52_HYAVF|nr:hypothetical protein L207DRAFT_433854 [Hyaloscypha variabilis F]
MSSDLLAEFDSFYRAPQDAPSNPTPPSNDLSFLGNTSQNGHMGRVDVFSQRHTPATGPTADIWGDMSSFQQAAPQKPATSQDDMWGSFEAVPEQDKAKPPGRNMGQVNYRQTASLPLQEKPEVVRRSTLDLFSGNTNDLEHFSSYRPTTKPLYQVPPPSKPTPIRKSSSGGEILFDADEISNEPEDDDEFGDFETVTSTAPVSQPQPLLNDLFGATTLGPKQTKKPSDLLTASANLTSSMLPYPQAPKSPSFQERNPFAELGLATKQLSSVKSDDKPKSASPVTAWPTFEPTVAKPDLYRDSPVAAIQDEEEWGDFADLPPETPAVEIAKAASGIEADAWAWDAADQVTEAAQPVQTAPPTNIPPPSVLLALFPPLFDLPQSTLFKAVANQPFSLKNRIISDPTTVDFLRAYVLIAVVAARLIAGRKLRWKRDTLLSQAMKIGPAAAGGKGGMKLTGVDKAEATREDREAADVVRAWKEQLGRLRSAVAVANSSIKDASSHLVIPEFNEAMHVKTQEGGLTAPKPCLICGLKREERINKVDVQVEDSFGEWWVEHWGHRACRNFWMEHESKLKHR